MKDLRERKEKDLISIADELLRDFNEFSNFVGHDDGSRLTSCRFKVLTQLISLSC